MNAFDLLLSILGRDVVDGWEGGISLSYSIGLGLVLNMLCWLGVVVTICCVEVFIIKEFFPGNAAGRRSRRPGRR